MAAEFQALGTLVANADIRLKPGSARDDRPRHARVLACTLFGVEREQWVWPFPQPQPQAARRRRGRAYWRA